jgi:hypothetical protein
MISYETNDKQRVNRLEALLREAIPYIKGYADNMGSLHDNNGGHYQDYGIFEEFQKAENLLSSIDEALDAGDKHE